VPIYEYRCEHCEDTFEVLTSFADRGRPQPCPACASGETSVQVSRFAAFGGGPAMDAAMAPVPSGGGCACGGACSCGGH
jgi:putative FmdB family regulatory protein